MRTTSLTCSKAVKFCMVQKWILFTLWKKLFLACVFYCLLITVIEYLQYMIKAVLFLGSISVLNPKFWIYHNGRSDTTELQSYLFLTHSLISCFWSSDPSIDSIKSTCCYLVSHPTSSTMNDGNNENGCWNRSVWKRRKRHLPLFLALSTKERWGFSAVLLWTCLFQVMWL